MQSECKTIIDQLGTPGAAERLAKKIKKKIDKKKDNIYYT